jgi:hypothetical protein
MMMSDLADGIVFFIASGQFTPALNKEGLDSEDKIKDYIANLPTNDHEALEASLKSRTRGPRSMTFEEIQFIKKIGDGTLARRAGAGAIAGAGIMYYYTGFVGSLAGAAAGGLLGLVSTQATANNLGKIDQAEEDKLVDRANRFLAR